MYALCSLISLEGHRVVLHLCCLCIHGGFVIFILKLYGDELTADVYSAIQCIAAVYLRHVLTELVAVKRVIGKRRIV